MQNEMTSFFHSAFCILTSAFPVNTDLDGNEKSDYPSRPCPAERSNEPGGSGGGSDDGKTILAVGGAGEPSRVDGLLGERVRASWILPAGARTGLLCALLSSVRAGGGLRGADDGGGTGLERAGRGAGRGAGARWLLLPGAAGSVKRLALWISASPHLNAAGMMR